MTTWIESSNLKQDGTPVTTRIKIDEMAEDIWFTDNAYAEVAVDVADILANNIDSITKVSEPSSPGTYYGDASDNTTIQINISDGVFDAVTLESLDADSVSTEQAVNGRLKARSVSGGDGASLGTRLTQPRPNLFAEQVTVDMFDGVFNAKDPEIYPRSDFR